MKRGFLSLLLIAAATPANSAVEETVWTLAAAVHQARTASPEAHAAAARVEAVRAAQARVKAGQWPALALEGRYLQTTEAMSAFGAILNQGSFDEEMNFNDPGRIDAFTAALQARHVLYTGGRQRAAEAAAAAHSASAEAEREAQLQALELEVARTWFGVREVEAANRTLEAAIEALAENLRVSRVREEAGELHPTERLNLTAEHARRRQQLLAGKHAEELGRRQLAFLLGLPIEEPLQLAPDPASPIKLPADFSWSHHPRLRAMKARLREADAHVRRAQGGHLPTVETFARYQFDKGWRRTGEGDSWMAGIAVRVPIFDGFATRSDQRVALAQRQAERSVWNRTQAELALAMVNEQSRHALAEAEVRVATERVLQARASADLSRARYVAGSLSSTDLIDVEAQLIAAEMDLIRARYEEQFARATLRHAGGLPLFAETPSS